MNSAKSFWLSLAVIELLVVILHLRALHAPHFEGDEIVLTYLAERIRETPLSYNVQGELTADAATRFVHDVAAPHEAPPTSVDRASLIYDLGTSEPKFDPQIYDRPLFFHPPVYPYLLAAFRSVFGSGGGIMLSSIAHALAILFLAVLGRAMFSDAVGLLAAALLAADPVSWVCAERLWIDGPLQAAVTGAALAAWWSARDGGVPRFAIAGVILGLAGLTKLTAGLLLPAVITLWLVAPRRPTAREIAAFVAAAAIVVAPWLIVSKVIAGSFLSMQRPTPWMLEQFNWVRLMANRPAWFYVVGLLLVAPVYAFSIALLTQRRLRQQRAVWFVAAWALSVIVVLTIIGAAGVGFQLRYLSLGLPALCLLAAVALVALPRPWQVLAAALALYGLLGGIDGAGMPAAVEPLPRALAAFLRENANWSIKEIFPGFW